MHDPLVTQTFKKNINIKSHNTFDECEQQMLCDSGVQEHFNLP
jgi:hypothetical protein